MSLCAAISTVLFVPAFPHWRMDIAPTTSEQKQLYRDWRAHRYHAPSDDLDQPVDLAGGREV